MTGRVLIVDDSSVNRHLLSQLVRSLGAEVVAVAGGPAALDFVSREPPDLVLLDMRMPEMDGLAVLGFLKSQEAGSHIPVIMISGEEEADTVVGCLEAGAEDYLTKPYEPTILKARVRACLERKLLRDREQLQLRELANLRNELVRVREDLAQALTTTAQAALKDPVTNLLSKRAGTDHLQRMLAQSQQFGVALTCILIEVDNYSAWAARLGLAAGERILQVAGQSIASLIDPSQLACRFGSADFLLACPHLNATQAQELVQKLSLTMPQMWFDQLEQTLSFSAGLAPASGLLSELLSHLDKALAEAKKQGGGHWCVYDSSLSDAPLPRWSPTSSSSLS